MTLTRVREELHLNNEKISENYVAISLLVNEKGDGYHSALSIGCEGDEYFFHFPNNDIEIELKENVFHNEVIFHKKLDFIKDDPRECYSFLAHCERIQKKSNIQYGFLFDGSVFDPVFGDNNSDFGLPNITTCSGFCNKIIGGFLLKSDSFLATNEWPAIDLGKEDKWVVNLVEKMVSNLQDKHSREELLALSKRIKPIELTTAGFYKDKFPVPKSFVEENLNLVESRIKREVIHY